MSKTRYRIVPDLWLGFEAQYKPWWSPWWSQIGFSNTSETIEEAKKIIDAHKQPAVYEE